MFVQNASGYFAALEDDISKIKPSETIDVISALTTFREYFENESAWEQLMLRTLDILQKGIKRSMFDGIASFRGMTHIAYVIHDLAVSTPKLNSFYKDINKILLDSIAEFLKASDKDDFYTKGNYEVIRGLSGPLSYLIYANGTTEDTSEGNDNARMCDIIGQIVDVFIRRSKEFEVLGHRVPGWHYYVSAIVKSLNDYEAKNGVVNYGLSHGMAAPLVTLAMAHRNGIHKEGLAEAIDGLISEFMKSYYYVNDIVYWPGMITFEQYVGLEERHTIPKQMSWCYGSVGILRSLYIAGIMISNSEVEQFALKEFVKIAEMNLSDYALVQMVVCHGFAGTAAILNAMHLDTGKVEFLQKTIEMIESCAILNVEQFIEHENKLAHMRNLPLRASLHNHLEGYCGVIQTILSILKGVPDGNDRRLLIV